jgi:hypothetical protein
LAFSVSFFFSLGNQTQFKEHTRKCGILPKDDEELVREQHFTVRANPSDELELLPLAMPMTGTGDRR